MLARISAAAGLAPESSPPTIADPRTIRRSLGHELYALPGGRARAGVARRRPRRRRDRAAHRPQRRSGRARSDDQPRLRRAPRLRRVLRQALRRHARSQDRASARHRLRVGGRGPLGRDQAPPRRQVPRRRAVQRGGGAVQHRAPPHDAGVVPQERDRRGQERRRRQRSDRATEPLGAPGAAPRRAHRPRRHDGFAQGGAGAGREVRHAPGVRGALPVRRARRPGQDRGGALRGLLGQGERARRPGRVRAHHGLDGAAGEPARGRPPDDRARLPQRSGANPRRQPPQGRRRARARLPDDPAQPRQWPARQAARVGRPRAPGDRSRHRSRDSRQDRLQRRVHPRQPVGQPVEPVLQRQAPRQKTRRRPRPPALARSRAAEPRLHAHRAPGARPAGGGARDPGDARGGGNHDDHPDAGECHHAPGRAQGRLRGLFHLLERPAGPGRQRVHLQRLQRRPERQQVLHSRGRRALDPGPPRRRHDRAQEALRPGHRDAAARPAAHPSSGTGACSRV